MDILVFHPDWDMNLGRSGTNPICLQPGPDQLHQVYKSTTYHYGNNQLKNKTSQYFLYQYMSGIFQAI